MLDKSEILLLYIRLSIFRFGLLKTAVLCNISTAQKGGVWLINQSTKWMENAVISPVCSHENMFSRLLKNSGGKHIALSVADNRQKTIFWLFSWQFRYPVLLTIWKRSYHLKSFLNQQRLHVDPPVFMRYIIIIGILFHLMIWLVRYPCFGMEVHWLYF